MRVPRPGRGDLDRVGRRVAREHCVRQGLVVDVRSKRARTVHRWCRDVGHLKLHRRVGRGEALVSHLHVPHDEAEGADVGPLALRVPLRVPLLRKPVGRGRL